MKDKKIDEPLVTKLVKKHLEKQWKIVSETELHEKGCDLVLMGRNNPGTRFLIECKGKSYAKHARAVNETQWLYGLGQLVTRMSVIAPYAYRYGLGLPEVSAKKALKRIPWQAAKHLCLYIFSVDDKGKVTTHLPSSFREIQSK
jgi:hypothetical protein